jgi:hypothetical protein
MTYDDVIEKQLLRLETQRDRLCLYLWDVKVINCKIIIERQIADIDFKVIGLMERMNQNVDRLYQMRLCMITMKHARAI